MRALVLLVFLAAVRFAAAAAGGNPAASITREAGRLQKMAGAASKDPAAARLSSFVGRVREDVRNGRLYLALEDLSRAREASLAVIAGTRRGRAEDFDARWKADSAALARFTEGAKAWDWTTRSAAIRALGEDALGKVLPLVAASRPYAAAAGEEAGLYYLAEARSGAEFAQFCRGLEEGSRKAPSLPIESIAGDLRRIQDRTNAAFQPPRSIERHSEFIRLNAMLKTAGELDAAGFHAGALYEYLQAVQQLAGIEGRPQPSNGADPRPELVRRHAELANSVRDDSLALLFVERGEAALDRSSDPAARALAAVTLEDVLPAYEAAHTGAAPAGKTLPALVTVTLVRWPYT